MHKILSLAAGAALFAAPAAFAINAQTHHCEVNGSEVVKTKAECKKAGGKWAKGAPAATAPTPSTTSAASSPNAGTPSAAPATPDRSPAMNGAIPANTPPTPNGNNQLSPPKNERTPGN